MAKPYKVHRGTLHDVRRQLGDYLGDLSVRVGGPDNPEPGYNEIATRWQGQWAQKEYYKGDQVTDDLWLMIANKTTTDRAAPQPLLSPEWLLPEVPLWTVLQYSGVVFSGVRVIPPPENVFTLTAIRVWITAAEAGNPNAKFQTVVVDNNRQTARIGREFTGDIVTSEQWVEVNIVPTFISGDDDITVLVQQWNTSASTNFDHPWIFTGTSQISADPGSGNWNRDNQNTTVRVNTTDENGIPVGADLATVVPGTPLRISDQVDPTIYTDYQITDITDNGTWYSYLVTVVDIGPGGEPAVGPCNLLFAVPIQSPTDYVQLTDGFLNNPSAAGYIAFDDIDAGTYDQNAYGVDVQYQQYIESPDWDVQALSSTTAPAASGGSVRTDNRTKTKSLYIDVFWSRWLPAELEGWAKLNAGFVIPPGPVVWQDVIRGQWLMGYLNDIFVDTSDPVVIEGIEWLESLGVLGPGRAAQILAP